MKKGNQIIENIYIRDIGVRSREIDRPTDFIKTSHIQVLSNINGIKSGEKSKITNSGIWELGEALTHFYPF